MLTLFLSGTCSWLYLFIVQVSCLISSLEWCLSDKMKRRDCYLPLFNLADTMWSPLRVEMFKQLRHAVTSVVDEVFTRQSNPAGNEDAVSVWIFKILYIWQFHKQNACSCHKPRKVYTWKLMRSAYFSTTLAYCFEDSSSELPTTEGGSPQEKLAMFLIKCSIIVPPFSTVTVYVSIAFLGFLSQASTLLTAASRSPDKHGSLECSPFILQLHLILDVSEIMGQLQ